ncbi:Nif11-like leader peptide family natural product precursor [Cyanobacterium aponinum UTEX 3222]|uniref:Nif11-like leader peptide family natural product n=2 Tax=Cyanobacterium aponinum TaxID=379064 RepID=A0A844GWZ3_9CHRO|nr:Nif11-like leader peptide family natural product precursor [Cyanobacterium aponinum]WRL41139.1 Nif11-like leader peptide family natural product precursor [Cyanobacterium aponinum UTEX 3222]MBD2395823.1 Nif11-like leader peptide family natural product precursor [Cyanobacterium aponinum FACHB-4101]MTF40710.1 Nif11-like leader peptide family natural product precursor [Cyanobacterium aponinum 0216]PHV64171.1 Nif11-like leader peptide family natural product precursor [Cyanobacterium aponinum IPPA
MSQESAVQFLEAVPENEELQQKLVAILESSENDREDAAQLANEYGYDITPDELWAEIQKRQQDLEARQEAGELTDEELEAVAGGEFVATAVVATVVGAAGLGWTIGSGIAPKIKW